MLRVVCKPRVSVTQTCRGRLSCAPDPELHVAAASDTDTMLVSTPPTRRDRPTIKAECHALRQIAKWLLKQDIGERQIEPMFAGGFDHRFKPFAARLYFRAWRAAGSMRDIFPPSAMNTDTGPSPSVDTRASGPAAGMQTFETVVRKTGVLSAVGTS